MNRNHTHQTSRELERLRANQEELVERITRAVPNDGGAEPLAGLHLYRASVPLEPVHSVVKPSFCVIAQGSKEVLLGDSRYQYDASTYLLTTVELPASVKFWKHHRRGRISVFAWTSRLPRWARSWQRPGAPCRLPRLTSGPSPSARWM